MIRNLLALIAIIACISCSSSDEAKDFSENKRPAIEPIGVNLVPQVGHVGSASGNTHFFQAVFDPMGKYFATFHKYHPVIKLWEARTGRLLRTIESVGKPRLVKFSPDSRYLLVGGGGVELIRLSDGEQVWREKIDFDTGGFDPAGEYVWIEPNFSAAKVVTIDGKEVYKSNNFFVGMTSVAGSAHAITRRGLINIETKEIIRIGKRSYLSGVAPDPAERIVLLPEGNRVHVYNTADGRFLKTINDHKMAIRSVLYNKTGSRLVLFSSENYTWGPSEAFVYDTKKLELIAKVKGNELFLAPDYPANHFYLDGKIYSTETGEVLEGRERFPRDIERILGVGREGVAGLDLDGTVCFYPLRSGVQIVECNGKALEDTSFAVDSSGAILAVADGTRVVRLLDLNKGGGIKKVAAPTNVDYVEFKEEGLVAIGDGFGCTWDPKTLRKKDTFIGTSRRRDANNRMVKKKSIIPSNSRFVKQGDGGLSILDNQFSSTLATFYYGDGWHVIVTPNGYFEGEGNWDKSVVFVDENMKTYSPRNFYAKFYRPQVVRDAIDGKLNDEDSIGMAIARPAPNVEIKNLNSESVVYENSVLLKVRLKDLGGGVGDVYVYVNSNLANYWEAEKNQNGTVEKEIPLALGKNVIEVVAYNRENTVASDGEKLLVTARYDVPKSVLYVVAVGVDNYQKEDLNLKYCARDASMLADVLKAKAGALFDDMKIRLLTTRDDTSRNSIRNTLASIAESASPHDHFLLYISSHGVLAAPAGDIPTYYMLTSDVDRLSVEALQETAISQNELIAMLGEIPSLNKVVVMDTCHAGQVGQIIKDAIGEVSQAKVKASIAKFGVRSGLTIFAASQSTQEAIEGYRGHGLFTYTFVEGLKGRADEDGDSKVSFAELKRYVEKRVKKRSNKHFGREQVPYSNVSNPDSVLTYK